MTETAPGPRRLGRSIVAVLAGFIAVVVLSVGTDILLHSVGVYPPMDQPGMFTTPLLLIATVYRLAYGVLGGYITARLAPDRPVGHALALGIVGLLVSVAGAFATWGVSHAWYPLVLVVTAVPSSWLGGVLSRRPPSAS